MIEVTEKANEELNAYFADNEKQPIRVYLAPGGCSGPRLALALDEPTDADDVFEAGEYQFVVEKNLMADAKHINVDMGPMGFTVESELVLQGGGGCSTCGGGCG